MDSLIARGLNPNSPTLFIAECVLIYIQPQTVDSIISISKNLFTNSWFVTFEQINPDDAFGRVMVSNLRARGLSISCLDSLDSQKDRL